MLSLYNFRTKGLNIAKTIIYRMDLISLPSASLDSDHIRKLKQTGKQNYI